MHPAVLISTVITLVACTSNPQHHDTASFDTIVRDEATQMMHQYHEAVHSKGLLAEFDFLDSSGHFFWIPPGYKQPLSYREVKQILTLSAAHYKSIELRWDVLNVYPVSEDFATFSGIVRGTMTDTTSAVQQVALIESGTLIRRAEGWKLFSGQTSVLPEN